MAPWGFASAVASAPLFLHCSEIIDGAALAEGDEVLIADVRWVDHLGPRALGIRLVVDDTAPVGRRFEPAGPVWRAP